jgi:hypothetical protein
MPEAVAEPFGAVSLRIGGLVKRVIALPRSRWLLQAELGSSTGGADYLGEGESLGWLEELYGCRARRHGHRALGAAIGDARRRVGNRTLYLELNRLLGGLAPGGGFRTVPWVRQLIDLATIGRHRLQSIEGVYGRKVRHHGLVGAHGADRRTAEEFYDELYLPYIRSRHGESAHPRSRREVLAAIRHGFVLKVLHDGAWISGGACRVTANTVSVVAYGARGAPETALELGAVSAVNYFLLEWARASRLRWVDLLRSRPHDQDGVFEHKRRWGAEPVIDVWPHTALWVYPPSTGQLEPPSAGLLVATKKGLCRLDAVLADRRLAVGTKG